MKRCAKCRSLMPNEVTLCIRCGFDSVQGAQQAGGGRIRNGWALARQGFRVLMLDKALLVFPLLSGISCFLVLAGFLTGGLIVLLAVLGALVGSALNAIVLSALYLYATEGKLPEAFAGARLEDAFAAR